MASLRTAVAAVFAVSFVGASVADGFPLDSLTLVAILTGDTPRAMLTDPSSRGWVVKRGDLVGRPEGGGPSCRWRVADIHGDSVVFVRNESQCAATPKTKTLTLSH